MRDKDWENAILAFECAGDCHTKNDDNVHAIEMYKNILKCYNMIGDDDKYIENGFCVKNNFVSKYYFLKKK